MAGSGPKDRIFFLKILFISLSSFYVGGGRIFGQEVFYLPFSPMFIVVLDGRNDGFGRMELFQAWQRRAGKENCQATSFLF